MPLVKRKKRLLNQVAPTMKAPRGKHETRCTAKTHKGTQCYNPAIRGGSVCVFHGGSDPLVKAEAQRRIATLVDPALEVMYKMLMNPKTGDSTRFAIIKDILDRTGYKPVDKSEVAHFWDGDISALDDDALQKLAYHLERIAFGEDRARMLEEKRRTLLLAGTSPEVIEAEFIQAEPLQTGESAKCPKCGRDIPEGQECSCGSTKDGW